MEAISPTPDDRTAERDDVRSTKDDLLQKISKVDREIAKAESQIAKLKKKQVLEIHLKMHRHHFLIHNFPPHQNMMGVVI